MHSLLLISIGVGSLNALYYCLKAFAVRWLCLRILGDRVQFGQQSHENGIKSGHQGTNGYHSAANGVYNDTHRDDRNDEKTWMNRVVLTEGDVTEISQL